MGVKDETIENRQESLLLDIDLETGHRGASDSYLRFRSEALEYAFILNLLDRD